MEVLYMEVLDSAAGPYDKQLSSVDTIESPFALSNQSPPNSLERSLMKQFFFPLRQTPDIQCSILQKSYKIALLSEALTGLGYAYIGSLDHIGTIPKNLVMTMILIVGIACRVGLVVTGVVPNAILVFALCHKVASLIYVFDATQKENQERNEKREHLISTLNQWEEIKRYHSGGMNSILESSFGKAYPDHRLIKEHYEQKEQVIKIPKGDGVVLFRIKRFVPKSEELDHFIYFSFDGSGTGHTEKVSEDGDEQLWDPNGPELQAVLLAAVAAVKPHAVVAYSMGGIWASTPEEFNDTFYDQFRQLRHIENDRTFGEIARLAGVAIKDSYLQRVVQAVVKRAGLNFEPEKDLPQFARKLSGKLRVYEYREINDRYSGDYTVGTHKERFLEDMKKEVSSYSLVKNSMPAVMPEATHSSPIAGVYNTQNTTISGVLKIHVYQQIVDGFEEERQRTKGNQSDIDQVVIIGANMESGKSIPATVSSRIAAHIRFNERERKKS